MTAVVAIAIASVVMLVGGHLRPRMARQPADGGGDTTHADGGAVAVLEDVERDLHSGVGLLPALRAALARHRATLPSLRGALDTGARLRDALTGARPAGAAEVLAVQTLRACEQSGGAMGAAVERAVLVLRERQAWERERRVHAAQARLSATVLTFVPLVFAGWGAATSPRIRRAYAEIPLCGIAAAIGLVLNLGGWLWMRRLVAGAVR